MQPVSKRRGDDAEVREPFAQPPRLRVNPHNHHTTTKGQPHVRQHVQRHLRAHQARQLQAQLHGRRRHPHGRRHLQDLQPQDRPAHQLRPLRLRRRRRPLHDDPDPQAEEGRHRALRRPAQVRHRGPRQQARQGYQLQHGRHRGGRPRAPRLHGPQVLRQDRQPHGQRLPEGRQGRNVQEPPEVQDDGSR